MKKILQYFISLYLVLRDNLLRFIDTGPYKEIYKKKKKQKEIFKRLEADFKNNYEKIENKNLGKFVTKQWSNYNSLFEKVFLPKPPFDFLRNPQIMFSMFMTKGGSGLKSEISYLEGKFSKKDLRRVLQEDYVGDPLILSGRYLSSRNSISHLTAIARFLEATNCDLKKINTIIEWGGGYGNFAKIITRLRRSCATYVLIDTPLFCCLQWLYLGTVFGRDKVNLIKDSKSKIELKKFNLLPVSLIDKYKLEGKLFVSTWALSESSRYSQEYIFNRKWLGARNLLIAYQKNNPEISFAERVGKRAELSGACIAEIKELPGNFYAFK